MLTGKSWILKILTQLSVSTKDIPIWIVIYAQSLLKSTVSICSKHLPGLQQNSKVKHCPPNILVSMRFLYPPSPGLSKGLLK